MFSDRGLISTFRWVAIAEATSFVLLLIAMIFKYGFDQEVGVQVLGPIHGMLFLAYVALAFLVWPKAKWSASQLIIALLLSVIPLGTLYVERKMVPSDAELAA